MHCLYKIIAKVLAIRVKKLFSKAISREEFKFLDGRQIHDAIGATQDALHSIKTKNLPTMVMKLDLSNAYDKANSLYIKLMLLHVGFSLPIVKWIMEWLTSVSFPILINGSSSNFFNPTRALTPETRMPLVSLVVCNCFSQFR
jgi:hypothetical protein